MTTCPGCHQPMSITRRSVQADTDRKRVYLQATCPSCEETQELQLVIVYAPYRFVVPTGPETALRLPAIRARTEGLAECARCNAIVVGVPHIHRLRHEGQTGQVELCPTCYQVLRYFLPLGRTEPEPEF